MYIVYSICKCMHMYVHKQEKLIKERKGKKQLTKKKKDGGEKRTDMRPEDTPVCNREMSGSEVGVERRGSLGVVSGCVQVVVR